LQSSVEKLTLCIWLRLVDIVNWSACLLEGPKGMNFGLLGLGLSGEKVYLPLIQDSLILMVDFSFLQLKSEAIVSLHRHANIIDRRAFTFEIHGATSMGKMRVPSDVIMYTFMTVNGHSNCVIFESKASAAIHRPTGS
jgi:hypothetical protein